jgi:hypothetical protein
MAAKLITLPRPRTVPMTDGRPSDYWFERLMDESPSTKTLERMTCPVPPVTLTCDCCGYTADFEDGEAAFNAGWDAPPHFSGYVSCPLCPSSNVVLGRTYLHAQAHQRWQRDGRPFAE